MEIIGRKDEIQLLKDCLCSKKSELVAIYGRRRVGKTFLVKALFQEDFTFYATGILNGSFQEQLDNLNKELARLSNTALPVATDWQAVFENLNSLVCSSDRPGKKIIFLDEVPWMAVPDSGFLAALDFFWNRWASSRGDVLLIICGSATSWVADNILNNTGGLHNRVTRHIILQPFNLRECEDLLESNGVRLTRYQIAEAYMVFGGIPYYLEMLQPRLTLYQNIDALYFKTNAALADEYDNLFRALFKNPERHIAVIEALASKNQGLLRGEAAAASGLPNGGGLTRVLDELVACGFIRAYLGFGKKSRDKLYQLIDPFTYFHLRFNEKRGRYSEQYWMQFSVTPAHSAWSGYAFEQLCLLHIPQIKASLGIGGVLTEVSSWRSRHASPGAQIDLVIERSDRIINLCEAKFAADEFTVDKAYAQALRHKRSAFINETGTRKAAHTTLISTFGLRRNEYSNEIPFQLDLDGLFI